MNPGNCSAGGAGGRSPPAGGAGVSPDNLPFYTLEA